MFVMYMTLKNLFNKYYSDKAQIMHDSTVLGCPYQESRNKPIVHTCGHCFDVSYSKILDSKTSTIFNFLEIGIGLGAHFDIRVSTFPGYKQGASLMAWNEYFPNATIYGWDVFPCNPIDNPKIKTHVLDATDEEKVNIFFQVNPITMDLIVDDGSHQLVDQVKSFMILYNKLSDKGIYIIEDILDENIAKFKTLECFPENFVENIIHKCFRVSYHDTKEISGLSDDFIVCFEKV